MTNIHINSVETSRSETINREKNCNHKIQNEIVETGAYLKPIVIANGSLLHYPS